MNNAGSSPTTSSSCSIPFYWYSAPALVKEYLDLVLEHGFAYGSTGRALEGKVLVNATTTGGPEAAYRSADATGSRCVSCWRPSTRPRFCVAWPTSRPSWCTARTRWMPTTECSPAQRQYRALLAALRDGTLDLARAAAADRVNDVLGEA